MKTILYLTDNALGEPLASRVREILVREAAGIPIVSVSQKPVDLGVNICVGTIGRSWLSLYKQLYAGLCAITTRVVGIAEHDCLYTWEHLSWLPPLEDIFYYNQHHWLAQCGTKHPELNGSYTYWPHRYALSQLVCGTQILKDGVKERIDLLENGWAIRRGIPGATEFGVADAKAIEWARTIATSGEATQLQSLLSKHLTHWKSAPFRTGLPNIDIRHGGNFTGGKRGIKRRDTIPYWGKFAEVMGMELLTCNHS